MRFGRWLGALGIAVLAGGLWYAVGPHLRAEESPEREFYLSSDPAVEVLKVRYLGSTSGRITTATLYAQGRFVYTVTDHHEQHVFEQRETELDRAEVRELMEVAVFGGLMEFAKEEITERMYAAKPPVFVEDGGTMFVDLALDYYRGPRDQEGQPASHRLSFRSPTAMAERHPEIDELQALSEISQRVESLRRRAELADGE